MATAIEILRSSWSGHNIVNARDFHVKWEAIGPAHRAQPAAAIPSDFCLRYLSLRRKVLGEIYRKVAMPSASPR